MEKSAQSRFNRDQVQKRLALSLKRSFKLRLSRGFTLVELLVVIAIVAILAAVVVLIINPLEVTRRGRDAARLSDLANLQTAINVAVQESTQSAGLILCKDTSTPCSGQSHVGTRASGGTGWVKVDLGTQQAVQVPTLPIDPSNTVTYHYTYCSNGTAWEIDTVLESTQQSGKMTGDGGEEADKYEVGSNLALIKPSGGSCTY